MQSLRNYLFYLLIIITAGCGVSPRLSRLQADAEAALENQDYMAALRHYEELIEFKTSRNREISGETFHNAGISAWELHQTEKAIEYLVQAGRREYSTERRLYILARHYREIDNLSLEITSLESYVTNYPDGEHTDEMKKRLFDVYLESRNYDRAMGLWQELEGLSSEDPELLEGYLVLRKNLGYEDEIPALAERLLRLDGNNITALEHLGEYYFWKAENRYQEEMKAYDANRTARQYRQLLDALEVINRQFRLSRDYFTRLWNQDPSPRYANFLQNIYLRFGDEEKAEYYKKSSYQDPVVN
jgi:hypothetical protein